MNIKEIETEEINRLIDELKNELKLRIEKEKTKFLDEIRDKADFFSISVEDLMVEACAPKKRKTGKIKPRYHNPDNQAETWTGRGYKPKWIVAQLERGKQLEDMLIN